MTMRVQETAAAHPPYDRALPPHDFNRRIVGEIDHRPWPMPDRPWLMTQTWHNVLFAHWAVDPRALAARIPRPLELDVSGGAAWIGVVPFLMTNVGTRALPALPWMSAFAQLNVRTYVRMHARPGVFFFSLDAARALAVAAARTMFHLPYFLASMDVRTKKGMVEYRSRRIGSRRAAAFDAAYRPVGPVSLPAAGSLEYFLTERYCLYTADGKGRARRVDVHHPPWRLQPAEADIRLNTMTTAAGLNLPPRPSLVHFAARQDAVAWLPVPVTES
jgi:uncharacterized protein